MENENENKTDGATARVCILSLRSLRTHVSRCATYEFEDAICHLDRADLVVPEFEDVACGPMTKKILGALRGRARVSISREPKVRPLSPQKDYELLFVVVQSVFELEILPSLGRWIERSSTTVCLVEEQWVTKLKQRGSLSRLDLFDYVFVYCHSPVQAMGEMLGRPCFYLPPGVDALSFCPIPNPPSRFIDIYCMGRRNAAIHDALFAWAKERTLHYVYDGASPVIARVPAEHRALLASFIQRSRYFLVQEAKFDEVGRTGGKEELAARYFEGAAGGAVLIGKAPDNATFQERFGWTDAVIPTPDDASDIKDFIDGLNSQPERLATIRRQNVINTLRRHDWVYRWQEILGAVGIEPLPAVEARKSRLSELAEMVDDGASQLLEAELTL